MDRQPKRRGNDGNENGPIRIQWMGRNGNRVQRRIMAKTTLTGSTPRVYRLTDSNPMRHSYRCVYKDPDVRAKAFNNAEPPGSFNSRGNCTTSPRYLVIYPSGEMKGRYAFCYWHRPKTLIRDNLMGNYREEMEDK